MSARGTSNKNSLPNSKARRSLKQWMLDHFGDGTKALCSFGCGVELDIESVTFDRFPVAGIDGGTYKRGNVRPACGSCNSSDGSRRMHERLGHRLARPVAQPIT